MVAPEQWFAVMIRTWEGGFQADPNDRGNYAGGRLVGTKYGVTPTSYGHFHSIPPETVTQDQIRNLTIEEAGSIGCHDYYVAYGFDQLKWGPYVAAYLDMAWLQGPRTAIGLLRRLVGAPVDLRMDEDTAHLCEQHLANTGYEAALQQLCDARIALYQRIVDHNPSQARFLHGWSNRARWSLLTTPAWAALWA